MIDFYVSGANIAVGRQGENAARNIYFDLSDLINIYGEGTPTLVHMRPSDQAPYICETSVLGTFLVWTPSSTDTAFSGSGKCELRWVVGETLAKSIIYTTTILPSITGAGEVPSPYQSWYDSIIAYIEANYAANGAPQEVREAIYTLLSKAAYTETGLTDELAIVEAWTAATFSITNYLTYATNSNTATMASLNDSYTATISAVSGYILNSVTVTMGGEDITATVYSSGTITIPAVTGDIVITATAVAAVSSLSAVYTQSGTVYDTDALDTLKADLVVTATYSDSSTSVIPSTDYTLSGTLEVGTSTVTVSYAGKTATFSVTVTEYTALVQGTHTFSNGSYITVYGNHVKVYASAAYNGSGGTGYQFNYLDINDNTTTAITSTDNANNKSSKFTIPANTQCELSINNVVADGVYVKLTGGTQTLVFGNRKALSTSNAGSDTIFGNNTTYTMTDEGYPTGDYTRTFTLGSATDIGSMYVYFGHADAGGTMEFDVVLTVGGNRVI